MTHFARYLQNLAEAHEFILFNDIIFVVMINNQAFIVQTDRPLKMKFQVCVQQIAFFLLLIFGRYSCSKPPHIIFMLIDDLGWNDVSFHGSPQIPTPNIDTLAFSGIILNNYYVQPLCTPSRGSLMTGKYPIRLGLQHYVISANEPWGLSPKEILLPQHLKKFGYATHGMGKWHLGHFKRDYLPTNRGFDSFFGYWCGKKDYFTQFEESGGECGLDFHDGVENAWNYTGYYATEIFTDKAKKIINTHDTSKPLFLYISQQAVHAGNSYSPLQAPKEYIDKFSHIKDEDRKVFAAMTSALDKSIGEVFSALHERNMLDNSILIFSTDNGGAVEGIDQSTGSNWPLRGSKYTLWEGGVRGASFIWSPLLAKSKGSVFNNLMHISDWLPTLYAAAGGDPHKLGKIDGYNFWPSFNGNLSSLRDHILLNIDAEWKVESIRKGQYKLLKGSVFDGKFDGWFDKEGKRGRKVPVDHEELSVHHKVYKKHLQDSEVLQILTNEYGNDMDLLPDHFGTVEGFEYCDADEKEVEKCKCRIKNGIETRYMHSFSPPIEVKCGMKPENASTNCQPLKDYCLFNIETDPCEFNNLAFNLPSVTEELKELLNKYRAQAVPIRNLPPDPKANPKYYGYAWIPWKDETFNTDIHSDVYDE